MKGLLEGKIAILTGAGSGMGLATARLFHREGAKLILMDISGRQSAIAQELGDRAVPVQADVAKADDVRAAIERAISEFGGVDILCNIAGANAPMRLLADSPETDFDRMIDVNLRGVFLTMHYAIPSMLDRGGGAIVNVASTAALIGTPQLASYSGAKAGVYGITRSVALEYAAKGIRANTLCPGTIHTPMMDEGIADNPGAYEYIKNLVAMRRVGQPEEIANGMLFLASDLSSYITGIALPIDGGQTAG